MIESEPELRATLEALNTLYLGLEVLRGEFGHRPNQLRLMAEGPLDEIRRLEAELQAYTEAFQATPPVTVWLTLSGGLARWAETPSRVLSGALESLRKSVQAIAQFDLLGRTDIRPTRPLLEASDPELVLLQPGSLRIGLRWRHTGQASLLETEDAAVEGALRTTVRAVRELDSRGPSALSDEEPTRRRVIFRSVAQLAPTRRSDIELLTLSGPELGDGPPVLLTARTNELAKAAIREVVSPSEIYYDGEIRELDLDRRTFRLRNVESVGEVVCKAGRTLEFGRVKDALDTRVRAFGLIDPTSLRPVFVVNDFEPLEE